MLRIIKVCIHVLLFVAAGYLFLWGLGNSLTSDDTTMGEISWSIAAVILILNIVWIVWRLVRTDGADN